ncbi:Cap-Gly domain-containing protein [Patellaria atrata CBS 101060]|uniref:Cap-Gly domain-containing protein n=1 Tax=Patellaria atrata CBS 101060 TaxID=1346257 RepID=A0A9P4S8F2_9PEZI|nr:Cap-Gly domain-containing protein [Patellaria atrata CBS 101060]
MSVQTAADIPLLINSTNASSERRVSPSWTIAQFKARLEPITGIPASAQKLTLRYGSHLSTVLEAGDEENTQLASFPLQAYAEVQVVDSRPPGARTDFTDVSSVQKYTMPEQEYESRTDSVLAWKKNRKLGRFDPDAPSLEQQKVRALEREIKERDLTPSSRVRLLPSTTDGRIGTISHIGPIPELPGPTGAPWIGITLDEPVGKNDGSVQGTRYFACGRNCGVFVRPERCEKGDWAPAGLEDEELEEI